MLPRVLPSSHLGGRARAVQAHRARALLPVVQLSSAHARVQGDALQPHACVPVPSPLALVCARARLQAEFKAEEKAVKAEGKQLKEERKKAAAEAKQLEALRHEVAAAQGKLDKDTEALQVRWVWWGAGEGGREVEGAQGKLDKDTEALQVRCFGVCEWARRAGQREGAPRLAVQT